MSSDVSVIASTPRPGSYSEATASANSPCKYSSGCRPSGLCANGRQPALHLVDEGSFGALRQSNRVTYVLLIQCISGLRYLRIRTVSPTTGGLTLIVSMVLEPTLRLFISKKMVRNTLLLFVPSNLLHHISRWWPWRKQIPSGMSPNAGGKTAIFAR